MLTTAYMFMGTLVPVYTSWKLGCHMSCGKPNCVCGRSITSCIRLFACLRCRWFTGPWRIAVKRRWDVVFIIRAMTLRFLLSFFFPLSEWIMLKVCYVFSTHLANGGPFFKKFSTVHSAEKTRQWTTPILVFFQLIMVDNDNSEITTQISIRGRHTARDI